MIQRSFAGLKFVSPAFSTHVYLGDQSIEVMRDILQSRYQRSNVAHKQLARTSLSQALYEYLFLHNLKLDMIVVTNCFCLKKSPTYNQRNFKAKKVKRRYLQTNNVSSYSWLDNCNVNLTCSICNLCCTLWILIHVLEQNSLKSIHTTVLCQQ